MLGIALTGKVGFGGEKKCASMNENKCHIFFAKFIWLIKSQCQQNRNYSCANNFAQNLIFDLKKVYVI